MLQFYVNMTIGTKQIGDADDDHSEAYIWFNILKVGKNISLGKIGGS